MTTLSHRKVSFFLLFFLQKINSKSIHSVITQFSHWFSPRFSFRFSHGFSHSFHTDFHAGFHCSSLLIASLAARVPKPMHVSPGT